MDVIAKTKCGALCGEQMPGYVQFLGIPYAKPPVGALRFRKPQPMEPWDGVRDAKRYGDYCPQPGKPATAVNYLKASEDCLTLNIFTPACDEKRRPVVVWIHGGAYLTGCASGASRNGGRMCIDADIVVVTIQYRLGAFGQIDFGSLSGAKGRFDTNCGTWDQVAAVNWVIENIPMFGGNPDCITLLGESAGGSSVLTLITTPYLKGKIKRAILESPAPHFIHTRENGRIAAQDVLRYLHLPEEEAIRLADLPAEVLVDAVNESECGYQNVQPFLIPTAPVVDGDLIPELPYDAVMHGAADGTQVLIGTTMDEGSMFALGRKGDILPTTPEQLEHFFSSHPQSAKQKILGLYPQYPKKRAFQELGKEIVFHLPSVELADRLAKAGTVYMFRFDYVFPVLRLLGLRAAHCTNSVLISGARRSGILNVYGLFSGETGKKLTEFVHQNWCRFIATGNPNAPGTENWPEYGKESATFLIDRHGSVVYAPSKREQEAYGVIRPYGN